MAFHLRPYLLMQVGRHPLFLQSMRLESNAEPIFATVMVRAQQLDTTKAFLAGNGRSKDLGVGFFQGLLRPWLELAYQQTGRTSSPHHFSLNTSMAVPPRTLS